jgi:regulator of replication initiation timing
LKKNIKTYAIVILFVFSALAIFDNLRISDLADKLVEDNDKLVEQAASFEKELVNSSTISEELKKEKEILMEEIVQLEEEVQGLKTSVAYEDFKEAIETVEAYKSISKIEETISLFLFKVGRSYATIDREGNCPCYISFGTGYRQSIEWKPNVVLDLKEFSLDKDKILLTYHTVEDVQDDYQIVMTKGISFPNGIEKWLIDEIKLKKKE